MTEIERAKKQNPRNYHSEYEKFKLQWMINHGYTLCDLVEELEDILSEYLLIHKPDPLQSAYADWEFNCGFGGELWPCFEEWLTAEGKNLKEEN